MSNARKLLIVLVVLGTLVAVGAIAYRVGYQQGFSQAGGFARLMENIPERLRGLRDGQPLGRLHLRMGPMMPMFFGLPRTFPFLVVGVVLIVAVVISLYAALAPEPASASRDAKILSKG